MTNLSQPPDHDMTEATVPVVPAVGTGTPEATPTDRGKAPAATGTETPTPGATADQGESADSHRDIDLLLRQAEEAIASVDRTTESSTDEPLRLR